MVPTRPVRVSCTARRNCPGLRVQIQMKRNALLQNLLVSIRVESLIHFLAGAGNDLSTRIRGCIVFELQMLAAAGPSSAESVLPSTRKVTPILL